MAIYSPEKAGIKKVCSMSQFLNLLVLQLKCHYQGMGLPLEDEKIFQTRRCCSSLLQHQLLFNEPHHLVSPALHYHAMGVIRLAAPSSQHSTTHAVIGFVSALCRELNSQPVRQQNCHRTTQSSKPIIVHNYYCYIIILLTKTT